MTPCLIICQDGTRCRTESLKEARKIAAQLNRDGHVAIFEGSGSGILDFIHQVGQEPLRRRIT